MKAYPPPELGPLRPRFNIYRVGDYFDNSPSSEEKECLKDFFIKLANGKVPNKYFDIGGDVLLICACSHIIELRNCRGWRPYVENIYKTII